MTTMTEARSLGWAARLADAPRACPFPAPDAPVGSPESDAWATAARAWYRGYDAATLAPECPECGRVFDLSDPADADEWAFGHDCEA
jgi:hypothetical protein